MSEIKTQMSDNEVTDSTGNIPAEESGISKVVQKLDTAVLTAEEEGMGTSELIGLFFYYAHNLAQEARDTATKNAQEIQLTKAVN